MTIDFQINIIKYLLQEREGKQYLQVLDNKLFDLAEHKIVFDLVRDYERSYNLIPSRVNLVEYFDIKSKETKGLTPEIYTKIKDVLDSLFDKLSKDVEIIREHVILAVKKKKYQELQIEYIDKNLHSGKDFDKWQSAVTKIAKIGEDNSNILEHTDSGLLIREYDPEEELEISEGIPTQYLGLNDLTAAGGFHSPQLIVIMAGPKAFKTGLMINIAQGYVRDGLNVFYADFDNNGVRELKTRFYQSLTGATFGEIRDKDNKTKLKSVVKDYRKIGGDIRIHQFLSESQNCDDVESELDRLEEEENWKPHMIIWDYADKMAPNDRSIREKRLKIQNIYVNIANVNTKRQVFSITPSQVRKEAVQKFFMTQGDINEDFAKIANAQAIFAWCRTEEELKGGYARIIPIAQRQGKQYGMVLFKVDEARMEITETSFEDEDVDYPHWQELQNAVQE